MGLVYQPGFIRKKGCVLENPVMGKNFQILQLYIVYVQLCIKRFANENLNWSALKHTIIDELLRFCTQTHFLLMLTLMTQKKVIQTKSIN